jgi:hypothetical protein
MVYGRRISRIKISNSDPNANIGNNDNDDPICKVNTLSNTKYIEEKEMNIIDKRKDVIIIVEYVFITFLLYFFIFMIIFLY